MRTSPLSRLHSLSSSRSRHGSNTGYTSGWLGSTPPDPRLPRWGLAGCRQLDPSHPAFVTCENAEVEPCRHDGYGSCYMKIELLGKGRVLGKVSTDCQPEEGIEAHRHAWPSRVELGIHGLKSWGRKWSRKGRSLYTKGRRRRWLHRKPLRPFGYRLLNGAAGRHTVCSNT